MAVESLIRPYDVEKADQIRDQVINELGYTVIRFENKMVFENLESVLSEITEHFKQTP